MKKLTLSDVNKKHLKIVGYLTLSGVLGWVLATYVADNPALAVVFAPAINYCLYSIKQELEGQGYVKVIRG